MSLRDQLQSIYQAQGRLTPTLVVDEARDEAHPLHDRFEWDDTVAGEKYRHVQAAVLIRSVKVHYAESDEADPQSVRAFHSVPRPTGTTYVPIDEVVEDEFTKELVLRQAARDWQALRRRYAHLKEFMDAVRADVAS